MEEIVGWKVWNESEDHKTGWEGSEWMFEDTYDIINLCDYEIIEYLDTDKYGHPTLATFKKL